MNKLLLIFLTSLCVGMGVKAQVVAVKSNVLYDATATVNLGVEVAFNKHWSLDISGNYNGWDIVSDKSWKHWMIQPEGRYWLHEKFNGHFFGVHGIYMDYDISNSNFLSVMKKTIFTTVTDMEAVFPTVISCIFLRTGILSFRQVSALYISSTINRFTRLPKTVLLQSTAITISGRRNWA